MTLHNDLTRVIEDARDHSRKNFNVVKESYGQYLARAILTSDVIAQVKADVWDEGYGYSLADVKREARNPYRQAKRVLMTHPHDGHDLGDTCLDCQRREEQS